ncbi:AfsR/SARP family transcriptional regulator [Nonomuraea sediminis]|uniref:AfsR/SARP family transcriptional regulator n=1 Tax=Nonomuraea sediminis TaxID=2835864 RepID=UPI001BDCE399|nr:AfsR/SARP family transcriptional regulator [Nonomuraea sediminis]
MLTFRVLGPLAAHLDGEPVVLGRPRQRSVLGRLLAAGGQVVPVDRLIDDLYADEVPPKALAAVQSYVSNLRRALEPGRSPRSPAEVLVTRPPGYALDLRAEAVDAWRFESLVRDPAAGPERLAEALALWHGPAYQEFAGFHWADAEAGRLEELRLSTMERHAAVVIGHGGAAVAVPDLERLVGEHPLREGAWALLARALYRAGRQGEALGAIRRARAHLAEELGVDPGPELRRLEEDILAQAAHLSEVAPPAAPPARVVAAASPYVGRRDELESVLAKGGGVVLVAGEPGAGKTALLEQVRARLGEQGRAAGWGRCPEYEGAPAGWAWAELLRELAARFPPADPDALAPLLLDTATGGDRFRLHRAVAAFVAEVAARQPLLLVLDDLHRADAETLAILTHVIAEAPGPLVVAAYRHTEPNERLAEALAAIAAHEPLRLSLDGLSRAEVGELISLTAGRPAPEPTVAEIAERTGGNPFFVKEIARLLDAEGIGAIPDGVRDVLRRRVARLPATAQTILRQSAVIGRESDVDVLTSVSGADEETVLEAIESGLVTGLLTEPVPGRLRFAHVLIRDTLYDDLSRIRRARLHARAARAIEEHRPADVAALAHHHLAAGDQPAKAVHYCGLAARQAESRFAHDEAAALWRAALDRFDGDPRERLELTLSMVAALANAGRLVEARTHRERAVRQALPLGDPELLSRVIVSFEVPTFWSSREYGRPDTDLLAAVETGLAALPGSDSRARCGLLTTLGFELEGEVTERGYQASREAVAMARRLGDGDLLVLALNGRFHQTFRYDGLAEREEIGTELLGLSESDVTVEVLSRLMLMQAATGRADFAAADAHAARARQLAERYDLALPVAVVGFYEGLRAALDGDDAAAERGLREAAERARRLGMWEHERGLLALALYGIRLMRGDVGSMVPELEQLAGYERWREQLSELYALALCHAGRADEARAWIAADPEPVRRDYFWHVLTAVRGLLGIAVGDRARAEAAYHDLLPYSAQPIGGTGYLAVWPTAQVLGDLAAHLGLPAGDHYRQALDIAERAGVEPWAEAARRRLAQPNTSRSRRA